MTPPDQTPEQAARQISEFLDAPDLARALETDELRSFLDHIPIGIAVSKPTGEEQRIVYANKMFEELTGLALKDIEQRPWSVLDGFHEENDPAVSFGDALQKWEDFVGTFRSDKPALLEAYTGIIENEAGRENYRIVALVDVSARGEAQRQQLARLLRDKDVLLLELQHRVKNNLQLITALIRLEARSQRSGDVVNLDRLAGRIESLQLLYRDLAADGLGQTVDLGHYLSQIAASVMHTYAVDGIRLDLKVDHAPVSINVAMPVGLIVNELLTNAFKYAFNGRAGGLLSLRCLHEGDSYRVVVADDGVGLPAGTVWPVPGKLSALILQSLRENAKTECSVDSTSGNGTRVTIIFAHKMIALKPN